MPLILPGNVASATAATTYDVANSCRFNDPDTAYMSKTQSGGNRRTYTISFWFKKGLLSNDENFFHSYSAARDQLNVKSRGNDDIYIVGYSDSDSTTFDLTSAGGLFRDPTAWYHLVVAVDTTQGTAANRMKVYINGVQFTNWSGTPSYPAENEQTDVNNSGSTFTVGRSEESTGTAYYDGYIAEFCLIDGSALAPTSFGEFDEDSPTIWKPKDVSGLTFGTNGFYLDFEDSSNLGNDANGGTDLTEANLAATDQTTDTPTNNFCTLNPLDIASAAITLSEGNCKMVGSGTADDKDVFSTFGITAGKWYWEVKTTSVGERNWLIVSDQGESGYKFTATNYGTNHAYLRAFDGGIVTSATENSEPGSALNDNDVACFAFDADNGQLWVSDSANIDISTTANATGLSTSTTYHISYSHVGNSPGSTNEFNFGNPVSALTSANADENGYGAFEYAPPSGYLALCTKNLGSDGG